MDAGDIDPRPITDETVVLKTTRHWFSPVADCRWAILMVIGALVAA